MNVNITRIDRSSNGMLQFYNGSDVVDSFSVTSSVSVGIENNIAKTIIFSNNVKTLSFSIYNLTTLYGATSSKIYSSGIDPSDTSSAYINRLYDIYGFLISDMVQGCCPGPTFVGGVVATYPNFASFPTTGQESVIYIDESTGVAYFWNGTSYQELISLSTSDKMVTIGRNSTGSTLYKGTIIYINGSTGNRPNFVKAQANSEATSAGTFGVILDDILNNSDGYAVTIGTIDNLDTRSTATHPFTTDTLADGDTIYLSPTTAGYVTNVKPYAPSHLVYIGKVVRTSPTNGVIVYRIQNGYELDEIHDVAAQTPSNNDGLFFESATSLWKSKSISTVLGYTPVPETRTLTINGTTQDLSADRTFTIASNPGTVTSVAALTLGTTGTDLTSTVVNSTSTPVITLNVPTASATNRGALSSTDWSTFNGKFTLPSLTSGSVLFSNGTTIAQDNTNLFWDNTNKRLGIGTNAPASIIDANGTIRAIGTSAIANGFGIELSYASTVGNIYVFNRGTSAFGVLNLNDKARIFTNGNFAIGTTTDAGFKLDVNGTARFSNAMTGFTLSLGGGTVSATSYLTINATNSAPSGTSNAINNSFVFFPNSGTANFTAFSYQGTINQTGTATGITRGLYINPTLTAAADWRAIEVASGITILGASTTAKASLRIPSGTAPTTPTNGDIWFDGTNLKMQVGGVTKTFTLV